MAYREQYGNYVRFLRGTPEAWDALENKDKDTLYFIKAADAVTGKLYLGDVLISGNESSLSLSDLQNILIDDDLLIDGSILIYDEEEDKWKNCPIEQLINLSGEVMVGATEDQDGKSGLVPVPKIGARKLFLRGDASWGNPIEDYKDDIKFLIKSETQELDNAIRWVDFTIESNPL